VGAWICTILWGFLPALNVYNGLWSDELSFKLHSLNFPQLMMQFMHANSLNFTKNLDFMQSFVDKNGIIDLENIARIYSHAPCSSCRGGKLWTQYFSDLFHEPIIFSWHSSPGIFDGKRKLYQFVCFPEKDIRELHESENVE